jgi:hypothetical protein
MANVELVTPLDYLIVGTKVRAVRMERYCFKPMRNASRYVETAETNTDPFAQLLFASTPLLILAYILYSAFESPEAEALKRKKKGDFELEGHGE